MYDFKSVMHYGLSSASGNGSPTMKIREETSEAKSLTKAQRDLIGEFPDLSERDVQEVRAYFKCGKF